MNVSKACRAKLESIKRVSTYLRVHMVLPQFLTGLANTKELIGVPGDNTSWQSTPAPLHDTTKRLCMSVQVHSWARLDVPMARLVAALAPGSHHETAVSLHMLP